MPIWPPEKSEGDAQRPHKSEGKLPSGSGYQNAEVPRPLPIAVPPHGALIAHMPRGQPPMATAHASGRGPFICGRGRQPGAREEAEPLHQSGMATGMPVAAGAAAAGLGRREFASAAVRAGAFAGAACAASARLVPQQGPGAKRRRRVAQGGGWRAGAAAPPPSWLAANRARARNAIAIASTHMSTYAYNRETLRYIWLSGAQPQAARLMVA